MNAAGLGPMVRVKNPVPGRKRDGALPSRPLAPSVEQWEGAAASQIIKKLARLLVTAGFAAALVWSAPLRATERPIKIVALGDSLTSGHGIAAGEAFPVKLEQALRAKGYGVEVVNAGVSGDTAAG